MAYWLGFILLITAVPHASWANNDVLDTLVFSDQKSAAAHQLTGQQGVMLNFTMVRIMNKMVQMLHPLVSSLFLSASCSHAQNKCAVRIRHHPFLNLEIYNHSSITTKSNNK